MATIGCCTKIKLIMKIRATFRKFIFLGILYIFVVTFTYLFMLDADSQGYISMIVGSVFAVSVFVYILKVISKGAKEILDEQESYYAVGYLFIKIRNVTSFTMLYSVVQGISFPTEYSVEYGASIFLPSLVIFIWSYGEINDINNMRKYWFEKIIGCSQ